jgi:hypothetical protein
MQYWLIGHKSPCPDSSWHYHPADPKSAEGCFKNSGSWKLPVQSIQRLSEMSLLGIVRDNVDSVLFGVSSSIYIANGPDSVLGLSKGWRIAEFNVVGNCCSSQANFNSGSTIVVRTSVNSGIPTAPACDGQGFTSETNNLYFKASAVQPSPKTLPAIVFTESTDVTTTSPCEAAIPVAGAPVVPPRHVTYSYCIGEYSNIAGGGCQNNPQKYWDCGHNSQDFALGEGVCYSEKYRYFKAMRTQDPVMGDGCGYSYGRISCSDTPDLACSPQDNTFGCRADAVQKRFSSGFGVPAK